MNTSSPESSGYGGPEVAGAPELLGVLACGSPIGSGWRGRAPLDC